MEPDIPAKGVVLNISTMLSLAQLLVILFGGIWALATYNTEMANLREAVKPLVINVQTIETRTELMQMEQTELGKRVDRIETKIDTAASLRDQQDKKDPP